MKALHESAFMRVKNNILFTFNENITFPVYLFFIMETKEDSIHRHKTSRTNVFCIEVRVCFP